jgi:hypothetical protein
MQTTHLYSILADAIAPYAAQLRPSTDERESEIRYAPDAGVFTTVLLQVIVPFLVSVASSVVATRITKEKSAPEAEQLGAILRELQQLNRALERGVLVDEEVVVGLGDKLLSLSDAEKESLLRAHHQELELFAQDVLARHHVGSGAIDKIRHSIRAGMRAPSGD